MTDEEVVRLMKSDLPINLARRELSYARARIENAEGQRKPPSIFEVRRMEFDAVKRIAAALGVTLEDA